MLSRELDGQWNRDKIKQHLKSAIDTLTPNVLDKIDLSNSQDIVMDISYGTAIRRRTRTFATVAAACLCIVIIGGGALTYRQNQRIDSVIGIDVNPSIELSINKKDKVLEANALNEDAKVILDEMELKGINLNVAVNAVIGSMVTHGYLDDLDNAILVTVSNDSISKANHLRTAIVEDIEQSLDENQVKATVYDQQVIENDEVKQLADQYGISYGKAYFLQELISQNSALTVDDMRELAPLSMEEIARKITERSYALGDYMDNKVETTPPVPTQTLAAESETTAEAVTTTAAISETTIRETVTETTAAAISAETKPILTVPETTAEEVVSGKIKIDYADYDADVVSVYFTSKVKWKNPTVSIKDADGDSYAAMIGDSDSDSCTILVSGLEGGKKFTFTIGGIYQSGGGRTTTVTGTFETPVIAEGATEAVTEQEETTAEHTSTQAETFVPSPTVSSPTVPVVHTEPSTS